MVDAARYHHVHAPSRHAPSPDAVQPPIVFVHGLKGSTLTDEQGNVVYGPSLALVFGVSNPPLGLPLAWSADKGQARDNLKPGEPVKSVGVAGVPVVNIYGPMLQYLARKGRRVYEFVYDWRRDPLETLSLLMECIRDASRVHGGLPVQLVGHSNGGNLCFVALKFLPKLVHSALLAAVPFQSSGAVALKHLHFGGRLGLNSYVFRPSVVFTFSSVYSILPTHDESRQQGTLCDKDGKTIDADLFDVDTWRRLKLGVFSTPRGASDGAGDDDDEKERGPTPERVTHLREVLHRGETFRGLLHLPVPHYPPLAVLSGVGHPTEAVVMQDGPQSYRGWDLDTQGKVDGDGSVPYSCSRPDAGVPHLHAKSREEHGSVLSDRRIVSTLMNHLTPETLPTPAPTRAPVHTVAYHAAGAPPLEAPKRATVVDTRPGTVEDEDEGDSDTPAMHKARRMLHVLAASAARLPGGLPHAKFRRSNSSTVSRSDTSGAGAGAGGAGGGAGAGCSGRCSCKEAEVWSRVCGSLPHYHCSSSSSSGGHRRELRLRSKL